MVTYSKQKDTHQKLIQIPHPNLKAKRVRNTRKVVKKLVMLIKLIDLVATQ